MMNDKCALMRKISEHYFSVIDIHLYQDTHPDDRSLDGQLQEHLNSVKELTGRYESEFGPLTFRSGSVKQWLASPWPWEAEKEG